MSVEILVNCAPRETRAALVENGSLVEVFIERSSRKGLVSNLYKGRVSRVLPGMQAAFLGHRAVAYRLPARRRHPGSATGRERCRAGGRRRRGAGHPHAAARRR